MNKDCEYINMEGGLLDKYYKIGCLKDEIRNLKIEIKKDLKGFSSLIKLIESGYYNSIEDIVMVVKIYRKVKRIYIGV